VNEVLVRASDLIGRPVVALDGDRHGEIKDVVLGLRSGALIGFTLRNPGFLGSPRSETLPWESVHAIGADAVMITEVQGLGERGAVGAEDAHSAVDIPLLTDEGEQLGRITDVVLETGSPAQVVGFEIEPAPTMPSTGHRLLVPLDALSAASADAVVVPAAARHFVHDDLAGFGAAVAGFRSAAGEERS